MDTEDEDLTELDDALSAAREALEAALYLVRDRHDRNSLENADGLIKLVHDRVQRAVYDAGLKAQAEA